MQVLHILGSCAGESHRVIPTRTALGSTEYGISGWTGRTCIHLGLDYGHISSDWLDYRSLLGLDYGHISSDWLDYRSLLGLGYGHISSDCKSLLGLDHLYTCPMPTTVLTTRIHRGMTLEEVNVVSGGNGEGFSFHIF